MDVQPLITAVSEAKASSWIDCVTALIQIAVPIVGACIAGALLRLRKRDTKTAEQNLRLALFRDRIEVFKALVELLRGGKGDWYKGGDGRLVFENVVRDVREFQDRAVSSMFLFDEPVNQYIDEVVRKIVEMSGCDEEARDLMGTDGFKEPAKHARELKSWLRQSIKEAEKVFHRSMSVAVN